MRNTIRHNLHQIFVSWDQALTTTLCAVLFPTERSYADETLSCRALRWECGGIRRWPRKLIDRIFFWQSHHCLSSWRSEREKKQLPPELR